MSPMKNFIYTPMWFTHLHKFERENAFHFFSYTFFPMGQSQSHEF